LLISNEVDACAASEDIAVFFNGHQRPLHHLVSEESIGSKPMAGRCLTLLLGTFSIRAFIVVPWHEPLCVERPGIGLVAFRYRYVATCKQ
jgi:hypothetical protein